jgi:hypothetical protein
MSLMAAYINASAILKCVLSVVIVGILSLKVTDHKHMNKLLSQHHICSTSVKYSLLLCSESSSLFPILKIGQMVGLTNSIVLPLDFHWVIN